MQHLLAVADIPAQGGEEGIDEFLPQLRFVVIGLLKAGSCPARIFRLAGTGCRALSLITCSGPEKLDT